MWKKSATAYFEILLHNLPAEADENYKRIRGKLREYSTL
jgi:hypothetical protein